MSDEGTPRDEETVEQTTAPEEPVREDGALLIVPGGVLDEAGHAAPAGDFPDRPTAEVGSAPPRSMPEVADRPQFTLDELVAEMAGVSAVSAAAPGHGEAVSVAPERVDALDAVMSDTFAEAPAVEDELWTRAPFWAIAVGWVLFSGVLAYLLWPTAARGFDALMGASLYGMLVWGGVALVVIGLTIGAVIRSRAQARGSVVDRGLVGRAILLRALGWTAAGVAVWVVALIVVSFHAVGVIR